MDFIAIGDTAVDEFIRLKDASVHCDIDNENCTISMRWGDKIPFEFSKTVAGVGNAANAAVAAARIGLKSAFVTNIGNDTYGAQILASLAKENVSGKYITQHPNLTTNHHYVLWFESERTILIKHEAYPYAVPAELIAPKWVYLSSLGEHSEEFHQALTQWLLEHPETRLAFQPGTFQMKLGAAALAPLYARTDLFVVNKQEAQRILATEEDDILKLLESVRALGPKTVIITDGRSGAHAKSGSETLFVPLYPDGLQPFERTGAGDAFASTVVAALALGKPLQEALLWGPVNSMSVVQKIGAQEGLLTRAQIEDFLAKAPAEYALKVL